MFVNDHGGNLIAGVFAWPDELRLAVRDALCRTEKRKKKFKDALISLEATEGPLDRNR